MFEFIMRMRLQSVKKPTCLQNLTRRGSAGCWNQRETTTHAVCGNLRLTQVDFSIRRYRARFCKEYVLLNYVSRTLIVAVFTTSIARKIAAIVEITIAVNEPASEIAVIEIAIPITSHDVVDPISPSSRPI